MGTPSFSGKLWRSRPALVGFSVTLLLAIISILSVWWLPGDPNTVDLTQVVRPPGRGHWFGTDELGRDILSRIMLGARTSLAMGAAVTAIGGLGGVAIGTSAGYIGGTFDLVAMRGIDTLMAFPGILLALLFVTILGPGALTAVVAVGIVQIPRFARIIRSRVLEIRHLDYVEAARAVGARDQRILGQHILPNCLSIIVVLATLAMGQAVLLVAGLGFLGLGAQPPVPEWGTMLADARKYLRSTPHVMVFPGFAIFAAILGFSLLGDGLRDAFDVRLR